MNDIKKLQSEINKQNKQMVQNSTISIKVKPHTKHYERTKGQKQIHMILKKRFKGGTRIELVKQERVERLIKAK